MLFPLLSTLWSTLWLSALGAPFAPQDEMPAPSLEFDVPEGMQVSLFAESPLLFNPTAMDVDAEGRVWVAEGVNYRQWKEHNQGNGREEGDRIVVLQDTNGDGAADSSTVFVQDPELVAPLGITVIGDRVFVACSPNLFVYRDTDGDLKADEREVFLTGFGGHDHDHGLHSIVEHPSGELVWCVGNAGPHVVTDAAGFTLRSGSMYNGGGREHPGNRPGLVSDDGRAWTGGLIGTIGRDGKGMRVVAHNFRNQYEVAVDVFGNMYTSDNDDDGNEGVRSVCLIDGGNYGFFSEDGQRTWQADRREGLTTKEAHWHQGDPGVMPAGTMTGSGAPCGVAVYEGAAFPHWNGRVLSADAGRSLVYSFTPEVVGAQTVLREGVLIQPSSAVDGDRGKWFRPSDVEVGPSGEIYVADWYDPGVGGHWMGDRKVYGRILLLTPKEGAEAGEQAEAAAPLLALMAEAENVWEVCEASDFPAEWIKARDGALAFAIQHADERVRLTALRAALHKGFDAPAVVKAFADDPSALVRSHAAAALRDSPWVDCGETLRALAKGYDGSDRQYLEAVCLGASGKEQELFSAIAFEVEAQAASGEGNRPDQVLSHWAWGLHPEEALFWLEMVAASKKAAGKTDFGSYSQADRRKALDGIAQIPTLQAAEFMVGQALNGPEDNRAYAADWVRHRSSNIWKPFDLSGDLAGDFGSAELLWRSDSITTEPVDVMLNIERVEVLWLVVEEDGNGNGFDWAAWVKPTLSGPEGQLRLSEVNWSVAEAGWGSVRWNQSADGRPMQVGGESVPYGLGTHSSSKIAFPLPKGMTTFFVKCAPDDGGMQGGATPTIRFAIWGERGESTEAQKGLQAAALKGDVASATQLSQTVSGALFLVERQRAGDLSDDVSQAVEASLQNHADLSVRALATEVFPLKTSSGEALPSVKELVSMPGDEARGRELFRGRGTCFVCHRLEGLGGALGPDLTAVGQKYDRVGILDSMLHPSSSIAHGYDQWTLEMKDGRHLAGSIISRMPTSLVLRDLSGKRHLLESEDILSERKNEVSTMPSALGLGLNAQDLVDITALLTANQNPAPRFGDPVELFNGKDLSGWDFFLNNDGKRDDVWSVQDGILRCAGNPTGYIYTQEHYTNFELIVEWRFDPEVGGGNSGVLLRVQEPHKTWPLSIEAQLQSRHAGDIWNIGNFPMLTAPERTNGRRTEKLLPTNEKPLGEWNRYRIRMHGSRLTLEINGEVQNTATWCKELAGPIGLQSEGVPIEFRKVQLRPIL